MRKRSYAIILTAIALIAIVATSLLRGQSLADAEKGVIYRNDQYGFTFGLPETWNGFSIVTSTWQGLVPGPQGEEPVEVGPLISIRHPQWTPQNMRQDIPIMIFTIDQWDLLQQDQFHIGAAPIGPRELGRNNDYVFALPARYNFAFPEGFEEVEEIIESNPLQPL